MAGTSKTARASARAGTRGATAKFVPAADAKTLVSLGGGTFVRIHSPLDGKGAKFSVTDPALVDTLVAISAEGFADKLNAEISELAATYQAWADIENAIAARSDVEEDDETEAA